jgi:hypothetical protein
LWDAGGRQRGPVPGRDLLPVGLSPARPAAGVGRYYYVVAWCGDGTDV